MGDPVSGEPLYGLVEAGGTKFVLGIANANRTLTARYRIPTTTPDEMIGAMLDWFASQPPLAAIGIASFGPVSLDRNSADWGHILNTPKAGWTGADLAGPLVRRFGVPVALDTDVNGAALAEARWGAGQGERVVLYFTIGTGVGGGAVIDGKTLRGVGHPEMGHIRLARHPLDHGFEGSCPFHGDCLEGLASGPAVIARYGRSLSDLPPEHEGRQMIAWYLGQAVATMQAVFEPGRIILGGGVMNTPGLIDAVRAEAEMLGGGYFRSSAAQILSLPGLGDDAGLMGALALAMDELSQTS